MELLAPVSFYHSAALIGLATKVSGSTPPDVVVEFAMEF